MLFVVQQLGAQLFPILLETLELAVEFFVRFCHEALEH
jgi:hypothetical protein